MNNCNLCKYISITEEQQNNGNRDKDHIYTKYNIRIIHRSNNRDHSEHNWVFPCYECECNNGYEKKN